MSTSLEVDPGTTLNLDGLHLYTYLNGSAHLVLAGEGSLFGGGTIIDAATPPVPLPSTLLLLGSGFWAWQVWAGGGGKVNQP